MAYVPSYDWIALDDGVAVMNDTVFKVVTALCGGLLFAGLMLTVLYAAVLL